MEFEIYFWGISEENIKLITEILDKYFKPYFISRAFSSLQTKLNTEKELQEVIKKAKEHKLFFEVYQINRSIIQTVTLQKDLSHIPENINCDDY